MSQELLDIIAETKKQLEHLRALGVEGIQITAATAPATAVQPAKATPAVAPRPQPVKKPEPIENIPPAKLVTSLFGDIAAAPVKLTPSAETFEQIHAEIGDCTWNVHTWSILKEIVKRG